MSELLVFIIVYAMHAATVCFLFVMLFVFDLRRWWIKGATLVLGLGALALPLSLATKTLGYPDPWPLPGRYDVHGWDVDENGGALFLFVIEEGGTKPYHMRVPFDLGVALKLQKVAEERSIYKQITVDIFPETTQHGPKYAFNIERVFADDEEP